MSQKQIERPQEKTPRQEDTGPKTNLDIDIGDADEILKELDIVEHPERYTEEQRGCGCLNPSKGGGFR